MNVVLAVIKARMCKNRSKETHCIRWSDHNIELLRMANTTPSMWGKSTAARRLDGVQMRKREHSYRANYEPNAFSASGISCCQSNTSTNAYGS